MIDRARIIVGKGRALPRGGARVRKAGPSYQLTREHCATLINASMTALDKGRPFNRFITFLWAFCGIDERDIAKATALWITLCRDWLRSVAADGTDSKLYWAWVLEYGAINGGHCHILLHVPPELQSRFSPMPARWAKKVVVKFGGTYRGGCTLTKPIAYGECSELNAGAYKAALLGKVHYMLKCAPMALEGKLGMTGWGTASWGQSNPVYGRRLAAWQHRKSRT